MIDLKKILQENAIVGAGGAGFPAYAKLADGADTLVINAAECEPMIYSDLMYMRERFSEVVEGAELVVDNTSITHAYLSLKEHNAKILGFEDGEKLAENVSVKILPDVYPMGDEINLIYQSTGRIVKPGHLPISVGVIVMNVETIFNVRRSVVKKMPVIRKWVTINGNLDKPVMVKVPIGMKVRDLFATLNIAVPEDNVVIDGGPSMGNVINFNKATVNKTTKALLILPNNIPAVISKLRPAKTHMAIASSVCCQCSRCTDLCPRNLLGYPLEPHKMVRTSASAVELDTNLIKAATLCCNCGVCELAACCQGISPRTVIGQYRALLASKGEKFVAGNEEYFAHPQRSDRMISSERWKSYLGVTKYDKFPTYEDVPIVAKRVEILMKQHIGVPSIPIVSVGDSVVVGQVIAKAAQGLSIPLHASIEGKVTSVSEEKIVIEA